MDWQTAMNHIAMHGPEQMPIGTALRDRIVELTADLATRNARIRWMKKMWSFVNPIEQGRARDEYWVWKRKQDEIAAYQAKLKARAASKDGGYRMLSDFEKGKIAQAQEDTVRFDEMIVDMKQQLADADRATERLSKVARLLRIDREAARRDLTDARIRIGELVVWKNRHLDDADDLADANERADRWELAAANARDSAENLEIGRLRAILRGAAKAVEDLAFKMPPTNRYTTDFVTLAVAMRYQMQPPKPHTTGNWR